MGQAHPLRIMGVWHARRRTSKIALPPPVSKRREPPMPVRSTLECRGSTPPWNGRGAQDGGRSGRRDHSFEAERCLRSFHGGVGRDEPQGGVEPPHSKVLRTGRRGAWSLSASPGRQMIFPASRFWVEKMTCASKLIQAGSFAGRLAASPPRGSPDTFPHRLSVVC